MSSSDLAALGADVEWPAHEAAARVRDAVADLAELGRLAELAEWVAGVRSSDGELGRVRALVLAADTTAGAPDGTAAGAAAGLLAAGDVAVGVGAGLQTVAELPASVTDSVAAGVALADAEIERGTELIVLACPGVQADAPVAVAVLTNSEPVKVLGRGTAATDPEAWMTRAVQVRDARRRALEFRDDPAGLLRALDSPRLAAAAALVLRAAARRTPVLLDGPSAAAAALVAYETQPRAVRWWAAADLGPEPLHELALTRIGQRPILGLGTGVGDGTAGLLALPVVQLAARLADVLLRPAVDTAVATDRSAPPAG